MPTTWMLVSTNEVSFHVAPSSHDHLCREGEGEGGRRRKGWREEEGEGGRRMREGERERRMQDRRGRGRMQVRMGIPNCAQVQQ